MGYFKCHHGENDGNYYKMHEIETLAHYYTNQSLSCRPIIETKHQGFKSSIAFRAYSRL